MSRWASVNTCVLLVCALSPVGHGQTITEIIDHTGDGGGQGYMFRRPLGIVAGANGNVYVTSSFGGLFKITPEGMITQIISNFDDGVASAWITFSGTTVKPATPVDPRAGLGLE